MPWSPGPEIRASIVQLLSGPDDEVLSLGWRLSTGESNHSKRLRIVGDVDAPGYYAGLHEMRGVSCDVIC